MTVDHNTVNQTGNAITAYGDRRGQILTIPGGFSYGDDLGAGRILASRIGALDEVLLRFHDRGGLILGICNGFQVLVKAGLLPGGHRATITYNDSGRFECRWVHLLPTAAGRSPSTTSSTSTGDCRTWRGSTSRRC